MYLIFPTLKTRLQPRRYQDRSKYNADGTLQEEYQMRLDFLAQKLGIACEYCGGVHDLLIECPAGAGEGS